MPLESFTKRGFVPAPPKTIWDAWIDGEGHSAMTGSPATSEPELGGRFTAWDDFIEGQWVAWRPGELLEMRWRTKAFPEDAADSIVRVQLRPAAGGTELIIAHSDIPEGQGANYLGGWDTHYFEPMGRFYGG